jgi:hypothetical protein
LKHYEEKDWDEKRIFVSFLGVTDALKIFISLLAKP